jgi:serine/threonine-protein kinase SRPK3
MGNILFRNPELESLSPEKFGQPSIGKVTRRDGLPSKKGVPDYLVEPIEFDAQYTHGLCEVQLIDFGECKSFIQALPIKTQDTNSGSLAFFCSDPPKSITTPPSFRPPELVFKLGLTNAVDIWNLGCTVSIQAHSSDSY